MVLTKLDMYDYQVLPGWIRIFLTGTNDPALVDIMSELEATDDLIYLDGHIYRFTGRYHILNKQNIVYLDLGITTGGH